MRVPRPWSHSTMKLCPPLLLAAAPTLNVLATEVTLWQFGAGGVVGTAITTYPLVPLGTAPGAAATTYLYQAINQATIITKLRGNTKTTVSTTTAPRTIVASASGWIEHVPPNRDIACAFVDATHGECYDRKVFIVSTPPSDAPSANRTLTSTIPNQTPTSSTPALPPPTHGKAQTAKVIGGVIGGVLLLTVLICVALLVRRRLCRQRNPHVERSTKPWPFLIDDPAHPHVLRPSDAIPLDLPSDLPYSTDITAPSPSPKTRKRMMYLTSTQPRGSSDSPESVAPPMYSENVPPEKAP
ncbi:hypothetical protein MIND_00402900 [Mycena indigotica]|uniref:Mid2 domain-containing protein n=1 Tax=Mycena indigotica TaxID=2126181 RepID=A0A8H6W937_9AGAR|nr:uncharacterized protein MIND_00402900 [Mycena indigotica]KAF7310289.1 hypothetical protein MIND_00402900 [Mycena indigotica]